MPVFLFTDIEGSTRLWEEHTGQMGTVIAHRDAILQELVSASGGRITKHTGDGITAAFENGEPLVCALQVQKQFAAHAGGGIGELRIRIGLHAGQAEYRPSAGTVDGDYFGPPVNATARILSAACGGQILLTPEVISISPLPPQATLLDLGQHLLMDVSAPQQIYQLVHPDLPRVEFPPLRSLSGQAISQTIAHYVQYSDHEHHDSICARSPQASSHRQEGEGLANIDHGLPIHVVCAKRDEVLSMVDRVEYKHRLECAPRPAPLARIDGCRVRASTTRQG